ncbi:MAG: alkaline phosphatase family protein, partial [Bacteroidetes bacterium]|nr:alkaline phosphatase family protein [Bacteroidota bacterium]
MKTLYFLLFTFVFLTGCQMPKKATSEKEALYEGQKWNTKQAITTIAFGSCDRQDLPQDIWKAVAQNQPDLWIWTGDNIYG